MTVSIRKFHPLDAIGFIPYREDEVEWLDDVREECDNPNLEAWTIHTNDDPVCIAGHIMLSDCRKQAWSIMGDKAGPCMKGIVQCMRQEIANWNEPRIEMDVKAGYLPGYKLARLLGFHFEGFQVNYYGPGKNAAMFVKVNNHEQ